MKNSPMSASPVSPSDRAHEDPQLLELRRELEEARDKLADERLALEGTQGQLRDANTAFRSSEASLALAVRALEPFVEFAWTAVTADCNESRDHLNETVRAARLALIQIKGEGDSSRVTR